MTGEAEDYESLCTLPSYEVTNTSWSNKLDKKDPRSRTKAVWELTVGWKTVRALLGWACTASLAWAGGGCIIILWQEPANISKNLQFILEKIKKLALAYTALHTTHAQRIQILRNKIVNAQDPSKYLLYCHTLYNAMAWSDIGDNARALSPHVHTCLAQHYLKMTWWDEERWVEDGSVLTIMHQEPGLTGPESYFTLE